MMMVLCASCSVCHGSAETEVMKSAKRLATVNQVYINLGAPSISKWRIITCSPLQVAFHHGVCHSQLEALRTDPVPQKFIGRFHGAFGYK